MTLSKLKKAEDYSQLCIAISDVSDELQSKVEKKKYGPQTLMVTESLLMDIEKNSRPFYRAFRIPKKSGGNRLIEPPSRPLKFIQWAILEKLEECYEQPAYAHGFIKGKSIVTNAQPHLGPSFVLNMDVQNFFHTIKVGRIENYLKKHLGFSSFSSRAISRIVTLRGALPMGAPTSPLISNLIFTRCDTRISGLAAKHKSTYTRYADDMTFSSNDRSAIQAIKHSIGAILGHEGFAIAPRKTRVLAKHTSQRVTGIVINEKLNVPREFRRKTRAMKHRLELFQELTKNPELALQEAAHFHSQFEPNKEHQPKSPTSYENILKGRMAFESMITSKNG